MTPKHLSTGSKCPPLVPGKMRLYSMRFCPFAQRVHLVLDIKNIPYDVVFVNLTQKPEWLTQKNSYGKVPCLELENGEVLYESLIVADYLDELHPEPRLYPNDPLAKAKDKLLIDRFNTSIISTMHKFYTSTSDSRELFNEVLNGLEVFDKELQKRGTPYFGGQQPGMLDLMIWPWSERANMLKLLRGEQFVLPRDRFAKLLEWRETMKAHPAIKKSFLDSEIHAKYMKDRLTGTPQYDVEEAMKAYA